MWQAFIRFVSEVCAIPPQPQAPIGSAARVVRAAPAWYRYRLVLWALRQVPVLLGIVVSVIVLEVILGDPDVEMPRIAAIAMRAAEGLSITAWLVGLAVGYALVRLDYEMRWYVITDRSVRIREGVIFVREMTLTFANVQNVTVDQGPLQRAFGIADLRVQTAGGGAPQHGEGQPMHIGILRGLDDAPALREQVIARMRAHADAGLGDPEERARAPEAVRASACAALVAEASALAEAAERIVAARHRG